MRPDKIYLVTYEKKIRHLVRKQKKRKAFVNFKKAMEFRDEVHGQLQAIKLDWSDENIHQAVFERDGS